VLKKYAKHNSYKLAFRREIEIKGWRREKKNDYSNSCFLLYNKANHFIKNYKKKPIYEQIRFYIYYYAQIIKTL